jgi:hypothetical protein
MFTGFASENTPAIQVWDLFNDFASAGTNRRFSLADDCAPIQVFKTGVNQVNIFVYLPSMPIEGKQIKIINTAYGGFNQKLSLFSSDVSGNGTALPILIIGPGQTVDICYSKNFISFGSGGGNYRTGWITLNSSPASSANYNAVLLGGSNNNAMGGNSAVLGGANNLANNTGACIIGGIGNTASGDGSGVIAGSSNTAGGNNSFVGGGSSNNALDTNSAVLGGNSHLCTGSASVIVGGTYGSSRSIIGNLVLPASQNPIVSSYGLSQSATLVLGRETTNATATRLTSNNSATGTTVNQVILPNNSAYTFQGTCIAARTAAGDTSSWKFEGAIKRGANAASTALVAAVTPTVIAQDAGAVTWVLAVTADTTNGGIAVTVTGAAATTIRWVAKIETTEVTF